MSRISKWILNQFGLGDERLKPPPHYETIAEGVLVTATKAEAWLSIQTSNTDHVSTDDMLDNLRSVIRTTGGILEGAQCHLKVVWGRVSGEDYLASAEEMARGGAVKSRLIFEERAQRIDELGEAERHILLGVLLEDRASEDAAVAGRTIGDWTGLGRSRGVTDSVLLRYMAKARHLAQSLAGTEWRATMAPAEEIAWVIGREQGRGATAVPRRGTITGANLAQLSSGKVIPHEDFLEFKDPMGNVSGYAAVLIISDFPDETEIPGNGTYLKDLAGIQRLRPVEDEQQATEIVESELDTQTYFPVLPDFSERFTVLRRQKAMKMGEEARKTAKEQRRSAARHSAGEVPQDIEEAEVTAEEVVLAIKNNSRLVDLHPRFIVRAATLEELDASVDAVIGEYAGKGITVTVGADEQRVLFLESLMGDSLRVTDLGHIQDDTAFFGSFFWGGASGGNASGPVAGYLTGTTPGLFRSNIVSTAAKGLAMVNLYLGASGLGKTTAIMIDILNGAALGPEAVWGREKAKGLAEAGALDDFGPIQWVLDIKRDMTGLVPAAHHYGIDSELITITDRYRGAADIFLSERNPQRAATKVAGQLALIAARDMRGFAESAALHAAMRVAEQPSPSTAKVIDVLCGHEDQKYRYFGEFLRDLAKDPVAALLLGEPTGRSFFKDTPGIWVYQIPGLELPKDEPFEQWRAEQRVSMALLKGLFEFFAATSGRQDLRSKPKNIVVPEVHNMLKTPDGTAFLDQMSRIGRAHNTGETLDSQDATGLSAVEGIVEQLTNLRVFQMKSQRQVEAAAALLGREPDSIGPTIRTLAWSASDEPRKGHCLAMDHRGEPGTVQYDYPSATIQELLNTNADQTEGFARAEELENAS